MSKVKELREEYVRNIADNQGKNYFEIEQKKIQDQPEAFDIHLLRKIEHGQHLGRDLIWKIGNDEHVDHKASVKAYVEQFDYDQEKIFKHFIDAELQNYEIGKSELTNRATVQAKNRTKLFLSSILDFNSDNHAANVIIFKDNFKCDPKQVEDTFMREAFKKEGFTLPEARNEDYEASVTAGLKANNIYEQASIDSLSDLMKKKHQAVGYSGDSDVFRLWKEENLEIPGSTFKPKK